MKKIIINADDFGWDSDATEAILKLAASGRITSTTIMANNVAEADILRLQKIAGISTGIHVNLIDGKPLSKVSAVYSLVDSNTGKFYKADKLWLRYLAGKIKNEHIKNELISQVTFLRDHGMKISHADSHQHIHQYPALGQTIVRSLKEAGLSRFRNCNIPEFHDTRRFILKMFHLYADVMKIGAITTPDVLLSSFSYNIDINFKTFSTSVENACKHYETLEFMVHPGMHDRPGSYLKRKDEYDFLSTAEWKEWLKKEKTELVSYEQI